MDKFTRITHSFLKESAMVTLRTTLIILVLINTTYAQKNKDNNECLFLIKQNNKYGFIDNKGKIVIQAQFDTATNFSDAIARVGIRTSNGIDWGYIDKKGAYIIEPQLFDARDFSEGLAAIISGDNKWGYTGKSSKSGYAIKPQFDDAGMFHEGYAKVRVSAKWGFIDKKGKYIVPPKYDDAGDFSESVARVYSNGKWGYVNNKGKVIIQLAYNDAGDFKQGLAKVKQERKWGYINKKGELVIQPDYELAGDFSEGLARISYDSRNPSWGYIDKNGNIVINPQYSRADDFSEGLALVGNKWLGYINKSVEWVIGAQFGYESGSFKCGIAPVSLGWLWRPQGSILDGMHYIDRKGNYVWKTKVSMKDDPNENK